MLLAIETLPVHREEADWQASSCVQVPGHLFPLPVVQRAAYELLGRWDVEIHPGPEGWHIACARVPDTHLARPLDHLPSQEAAAWEISSQLISSYVDAHFYQAHRPLREGLIAVAFRTAPVESVWEVFRAYGNRHTIIGPGKEIARIEGGQIIARRVMEHLPHVMLAGRQVLDRCLLWMESRDQDEIHIDLQVTDPEWTHQSLLEELRIWLNARCAQLAPGR